MRAPVHLKRWIVLIVSAAVLAWLTVGYLRLPDAQELQNKNPVSTGWMEQREREARAAGRRVRRIQHWVPLTGVSPRAVDAIIASEDASFWTHPGIDVTEILSALRQALKDGGLGRGASTITQQLAKNLWLSSERSLSRKVKEIILARKLEKSLTKKRILTLYLNIAEWGPGVYGIEAAARKYFGISAAQLSVSQSAILAAMLPAPLRWSPKARTPILRKRARVIVNRLVVAGKISKEDAARARSEIDVVFGLKPAITEDDASVTELPVDPDAEAPLESEGAPTEPGTLDETNEAAPPQILPDDEPRMPPEELGAPEGTPPVESPDTQNDANPSQ